MKRTLFLTAILIFALSAIQAQTLDEILKKHFEAVGQDKLMAIETYIIKAKVNQMGMEIPMDMKIKSPDKFRMDMDMQGQSMVQAFDGENGWMIAPWVSSEAQDLSGAELDQARAQADLEGELYNYEEKGHSADFIGKVKLGDKEAFRIKLTHENGSVKNYFLDADTYLIAKVQAKIEAMGQTADVEQRMVEYKDIDGVKVATKIESDSPMGTATITIEEVKFNEDIDDAVFAKPAK